MLQTGATPGADPRPLSVHDYAQVSGLAFRGSGTLSRLLRTRHALGGDQFDAHRAFMDSILDDLSEE